mmetsp:Transcript_3539/g.6206  ORF Transcript_3539/g.6206 Transcript_3539/m.6206 type:complete len:163 (-) Transcript_3539:393-881(-)
MRRATIRKAKATEGNKLQMRPRTEIMIRTRIKRHTSEVGRNMAMARKATIQLRQQQHTTEQRLGTDNLIQAMPTPKASQSTKGKQRTDQPPEVKVIDLGVVTFVRVELEAGLAEVMNAAAIVGLEDAIIVAEITGRVDSPIMKSLLEELESRMWRQTKIQSM